MLLFKPEHVQPILAGLKIKTRRDGKKRWNVNSVHRAKTELLSREYFALLRILTLHREPLGAMTGKDAREEGGYTLEGYMREWEQINGKGSWHPDNIVWVVQFERVFNINEICRHCWSFSDCRTKNCCVKLLFDSPERYVSSKEVVEFCCGQKCRHDREYHDSVCPVKLVGAGREYIGYRPEVYHERDGAEHVIRRLSDYV